MVTVDRYWCPPDGSFHLEDRGYLADPTSFTGHASEVVESTSLVNRGAVVLLGEPGSGKSTALRQLVAVTRAKLGGQDAAVVPIDLGTYGDESRVVNEVLRGDSVREWRDGTGLLFLFLDSLDECRLEVRKIASILAHELSGWPLDRLRLRIACRTADWPVGLGEAIAQGVPDARTVELLPLRRRDVAEIASDAGADAESFLRAVESANLVALAVRPLTLKMLLTAFADAGMLPTRTTELYARGLALLADEQSPGRRAAGHVGRLTADQRLSVASRLAALTLFAGAPSIATSAAGADLGDSLRIDECVGGTEPASGGLIDVDRLAVEEVLRTGLFTSRGGDRLGWAHQTYAEYLAARYLASRINLAQARELLTSSVTGRARVFPAFRQVAGWLVAAAPARYGDLVDDDPEAFLAARIPMGHSDTTERLVEAVLGVADRGDHATRWRAGYGHLAHERLPDQLRRWLQDRTRSADARALAADLAEALDGPGLAADLLAIFLNEDEAIRVRLHAGHALESLPAGADLERVRAVAGGSSDDPDDELKGIALGLLWPDVLEVADVLDLLSPPKRQDVFGTYKLFLTYRLPRAFQPAHLPELLDWLLAQAADSHQHPLTDVHDAIVRLALKHTEDAEVLTRLAAYTAHHGAEHRPLLSSTARLGQEDPLLPDEARRRLLASVIDNLPDDADKAWSVLDATLDSRGQHPLLTPDDVPWLIARHDDPEAPPRKALLRRLLEWRFHPDHPGHAATVLELPDDHELRLTAFAFWLDPVDLKSEQAAELRRRHEMVRGHATPRRNPEAPSDLELQTQIETYLDAFDAGDVDGYWRAQVVVTIDEEAWHHKEFEADLTALPRWGLIPDDLRRRFIDGAPRYLQAAKCHADQWLGTTTFLRPVHAAYRALVLLLRIDLAALESLPVAVWEEWAPIVLAYHGRGDDEATKRQLVQRAARTAPQALIDAARTLLRSSAASGERLSVEDELVVAWSEELAAVVSETARTPHLSAAVWGQLVGLLAPRHEDGVALATDALLDPAARADNPERATLAVGILLDHAMPERWAVLERLLDDAPDLAESALLEFAHREGLRRGAPSLAVNHLADLFLWLAGRFPPQEDPEIGGWVSPRNAVAHWRDAILAAIRDDGTPEGLAAFARVRQQVPGVAWAYAQADADAKALDRAWTPLTPGEVRELAEREESRLIRDSGHLHAVVDDALRMVATELQSGTPLVRWLWDERVMQPKYEPAISDYLKNRLDDLLHARSVVIGREVQVRHVRPTGLGDSVDLRIDAVRPGDANDAATIVIEVKGCWNQSLATDITTQLCDEYLRDCATTDGIYVVAWFDPAAWSLEHLADWRRERTAKRDWPATVTQLHNTAAELKTRGLNVSVHVLDCSWDRPAT